MKTIILLFALLSVQIFAEVEEYFYYPIHQNLTDVVEHNGSIFIAGTGGTYLQSKDNGETWSQQKHFHDSTTILRLISSSDNLFALVSNGYLCRSVENANTWQNYFLGDNKAFDLYFQDNKFHILLSNIIKVYDINMNYIEGFNLSDTIVNKGEIILINHTYYIVNDEKEIITYNTISGRSTILNNRHEGSMKNINSIYEDDFFVLHDSILIDYYHKITVNINDELYFINTETKKTEKILYNNGNYYLDSANNIYYINLSISKEYDKIYVPDYNKHTRKGNINTKLDNDKTKRVIPLYPFAINRIKKLSNQQLYAVGDYKTIIKSNDDGENWDFISYLPNFALPLFQDSLYGFTGMPRIIGGERYNEFRFYLQSTYNGGITWQPQPFKDTNFYYAFNDYYVWVNYPPHWYYDSAKEKIIRWQHSRHFENIFYSTALFDRNMDSIVFRKSFAPNRINEWTNVLKIDNGYLFCGFNMNRVDLNTTVWLTNNQLEIQETFKLDSMSIFAIRYENGIYYAIVSKSLNYNSPECHDTYLYSSLDFKNWHEDMYLGCFFSTAFARDYRTKDKFMLHLPNNNASYYINNKADTVKYDNYLKFIMVDYKSKDIMSFDFGNYGEMFTQNNRSSSVPHIVIDVQENNANTSIFQNGRILFIEKSLSNENSLPDLKGFIKLDTAFYDNQTTQGGRRATATSTNYIDSRIGIMNRVFDRITFYQGEQYSPPLFSSIKFYHNLGSPTTSVENQVESPTYLYTYPAYPNPARNQVRAMVYWDLRHDINTADIEVYDVMGVCVSGKENISIANATAYNGEIVWDCGSVPEGVYFIKITHGTSTKTVKVAVVR